MSDPEMPDPAMPWAVKNGECPACGKTALYVAAIDRFVHADGTLNDSCWGDLDCPRRRATVDESSRLLAELVAGDQADAFDAVIATRDAFTDAALAAARALGHAARVLDVSLDELLRLLSFRHGTDDLLLAYLSLDAITVADAT
jgi:hypothetical protein